MWQGKPIVKPSHADILEMAAAIKEFEENLPREEAEKHAYADYLKEQHTTACAHHLRSMRAAAASGDTSEAKLHGEAYHHHMGKLGYDSMDMVPEEVQALLDDESKKTHTKFKSHPADSLLK